MRKTKLGIYVASNVTFDPANFEAFSYRWWQFVKFINGRVVFNDYNYSNSTRGHQWKVRREMRNLGIEIDLFIKTPKSLGHHDALRTAIEQEYRAINPDRARELERFFEIPFNQDEIQAIYDDVEESLCNDFLRRSIQREERKLKKQAKAMRIQAASHESQSAHMAEVRLSLVQS